MNKQQFDKLKKRELVHIERDNKFVKKNTVFTGIAFHRYVTRLGVSEFEGRLILNEVKKKDLHKVCNEVRTEVLKATDLGRGKSNDGIITAFDVENFDL